MNDHQLLFAYLEGDEQAFEALVKKYFRMVYAVAARQAGDPHLAEEIAQSVFIILSRKASGLSVRTSIPGWLLRTTRFVSGDAIKMRLRRDRNERKLAMNLEHQLETDPDPSTLGLLLDEALQSLSPDEQTGIVARFFEGKDFHEIAEMFAITEVAARKRTSRCLAKLQSFMEKRGAKVSLQTLSGMLVVPSAHQVAQQVQSAIQAIHAAWQENVAAGNAVALANHAARSLRWRFFTRLSARVAAAGLIIVLAIWAVQEWHQPVAARIEKLGRAWGALDERVAQHRRFLMQTPATTPNYQANVQQELDAISRESSRIISEMSPLLALPDERLHLAIFLTAELNKTLHLDPVRRTALLQYAQNRLAQRPTLNNAMKALAEAAPAEAVEIKAMLSPGQNERFDQIYGVDGVLLFSYPKAVALGRIGD